MQRVKETGKKSGLLRKTCSHVNHGAKELVFSTVKHNGKKNLHLNKIDTFGAELERK